MSQAKQNIRTLAPNEILFNDGDFGASLYIIQQGQIRLFKPKGKGFVDIAVLRTGEVIGEMSLFDKENGNKRSCSAEAMTPCEIIEISFDAFSNMMADVNPWLRTISNTLAERLRNANKKIKELESNSVAVNYGGDKGAEYEFLKSHEILKTLGILFLVFKAHGEDIDGSIKILTSTLKLYALEIYGIGEVKFEAIMIVLKNLNYIDLSSKDYVVINDLAGIRKLFIFYQTEKHLTEEKKLSIPASERTVLEEVLKKALTEVKNKDEVVTIDTAGIKNVDNVPLSTKYGFVGDIYIGKENIQTMEVQVSKLQKFIPFIKFMNEIEKVNQEKLRKGSY